MSFFHLGLCGLRFPICTGGWQQPLSQAGKVSMSIKLGDRHTVSTWLIFEIRNKLEMLHYCGSLVKSLLGSITTGIAGVQVTGEGGMTAKGSATYPVITSWNIYQLLSQQHPVLMLNHPNSRGSGVTFKTRSVPLCTPSGPPVYRSFAWRVPRAWVCNEERRNGSQRCVARGWRSPAYPNRAGWYSGSGASRLGGERTQVSTPRPPDTTGVATRWQEQLYLQGLQARLSGCNNRSQAVNRDNIFGYRTVWHFSCPTIQ